MVWVDEMVGLMPDCWVEWVHVIRIGVRFRSMSTRRAGARAVNWIDKIAGSIADYWTERIVVASSS